MQLQQGKNPTTCRTHAIFNHTWVARQPGHRIDTAVWKTSSEICVLHLAIRLCAKGRRRGQQEFGSNSLQRYHSRMRRLDSSIAW